MATSIFQMKLSKNDDSLPTPSHPCVMTSQVGSQHGSLHPETSTPDVKVYEQFYKK